MIDKNSTMKTPEDMLIEKKSWKKFTDYVKVFHIYMKCNYKILFEEKSYEEIAEEENTTVKTIASRLYRGRIMLREKWREEDGTF